MALQHGTGKPEGWLQPSRAAWVVFALLICWAISPSPLGAVQVRVRDGQQVMLSLRNILATENVGKDDIIQLEVGHDVVVNGHTVIARGAPATCKVVRVKGAGKKKAKDVSVTFRVLSVRTVDNQLVPLRVNPAAGKNKSDWDYEFEEDLRVLGQIGPDKIDYPVCLDLAVVVNAPETPTTPQTAPPAMFARTINVPTGEIEIITIPPGVEVVMDGRSIGPSPVRATLPPGQHTYVLSQPGMAPFQGTFITGSGETKVIRVNFGGMVAPVQGYVISVRGDQVTVDLGSAQGIKKGARLGLYKAGDPNTRVGVLEVVEVVDAGNSRARIVTLNAGVQLEWADVVRLGTGTMAAPPGPRAHKAPTGPRKGSVTAVEGTEVVLDLGSAAGIAKGTKLAFYKADDPDTQAGVLEVVQVIGARESRARIVYLLKGVRPVPSDLVRTQ